jgi:hypothetical protein
VFWHARDTSRRALKPSVNDCWDRSAASGWPSGNSPCSAAAPGAWVALCRSSPSPRRGARFDQVKHAFIRLAQKLRITANGTPGIQDCWATPILQERMINDHWQADRRHVGPPPDCDSL